MQQGLTCGEGAVTYQQCFLNACYVLGTIPGTGHTAVNKITSLTSWSPHSNGENDSSQINQNGYNEKDKRNIILKKARAK